MASWVRRMFGGRRRALGFHVFQAALDDALGMIPEEARKDHGALAAADIRRQFQEFLESFDDQRLGVRRYIAVNAFAVGRYGSMIIEPEGVRDPFHMRGRAGITGELNARIMEIYAADDDLRELIESAAAQSDEPGEIDAGILDLVITGMAIDHWIKVNFWNDLRLMLDDCAEKDLLDPLIEAAHAFYEDRYREALGMESVLARDHPLGAGAREHCRRLVDLVIEGVPDPIAAWTEEANPAGRETRAP